MEGKSAGRVCLFLCFRKSRLVVLLSFMFFIAYMSLESNYPNPLESIPKAVGTTILHFLAYLALAALFLWAAVDDGRSALFGAMFFHFPTAFPWKFFGSLCREGALRSLNLAVDLLGSFVGIFAVRSFLKNHMGTPKV